MHLRMPSIDQGVQAGAWAVFFFLLLWPGMILLGVSSATALILSLRRMNKLRSVGTGVAVAGAGMILADLHERTAETGQRFPLTLGARGSCTDTLRWWRSRNGCCGRPSPCSG